ncbi:trehalase family glycosidase [Mycoplasmatota bacterium WC44]
MVMNIDKIPFSRRGSYFVISKVKDELYIRDVRGGDENLGLIFKIELLSNNEIIRDYEVDFEEHLLTLRNGDSKVEICISSENYMRIVSSDLTVRLTLVLKRYDHINKLSSHKYELHSYSNEIKMMLSVLSGRTTDHLPWNRIGNTEAAIDFYPNDALDFVIESYKVVPANTKKYKTFNEEKLEVYNEYNDWYSNTLSSGIVKYDKSRKLASYITWSSLVKEEGLLKREAMYMSKNWMTNIWSWDNCFNALALAEKSPELAYDQFIIFKDFQDVSGALPDYVNDKYVSYSCVKPPIHGWTYVKMMEYNDYFLDEQRLSEVYDMLLKMNNYWINYRNYDGLPYYNHGNDSGWDNATVFKEGCPLISPDLASYLILNFEAVSKIASYLGKHKEVIIWQSRADKLLNLLIKELYSGTEFYSILKLTGERIESKSLINLMPIVIGHKLPTDILDRLVEKISSSEYFTKYGFATEAINSDLYEENGYWRGPIWAPTSLLIIDGLKRSGKEELAQIASLKFMELTLIGGMAENFDPMSGKGLVDTAFTWTSSVFLLLSNKYVGDNNE